MISTLDVIPIVVLQPWLSLLKQTSGSFFLRCSFQRSFIPFFSSSVYAKFTIRQSKAFRSLVRVTVSRTWFEITIFMVKISLDVESQPHRKKSLRLWIFRPTRKTRVAITLTRSTSSEPRRYFARSSAGTYGQLRSTCTYQVHVLSREQVQRWARIVVRKYAL